MVGMAIGAIRPKGHNHLRFDPADMRRNFCNDLPGLCLVEIAVQIIKKFDFMQA